MQKGKYPVDLSRYIHLNPARVGVVAGLEGRYGFGHSTSPGRPIDNMTIHDHYMTMKNVGIAELKAHLSRYLKGVRRGHSVVILDRKEPIARVVPYARESGALKVRAPLHGLHEVKLPSPLKKPSDSLAALVRERQDRH